MTFQEAVKTMAERSGYFIGRPGGIVLVINSWGHFQRPDRKQPGWLSLGVLDVMAVDWGVFPIPGSEHAGVEQQA